MARCMRYCTLSMYARMPRASMRSKRLCPSPAASASREMMVGGTTVANCLVSSIADEHHFPSARRSTPLGDRLVRRLVASSMRHARSRMSDPAPAHVHLGGGCWVMPGPAGRWTPPCTASSPGAQPRGRADARGLVNPGAGQTIHQVIHRDVRVGRAQDGTRARPEPHLDERDGGVRLSRPRGTLDEGHALEQRRLDASVCDLFMCDMARRSIAWSIIF